MGRFIRIGMSNLDSVIGGFRGNLENILFSATQMAERGATIGVFPEQVVSGYPAEDLVQWSLFVDVQADVLVKFAEQSKSFDSTVFVLGVTIGHGGNLYNCAAVVQKGVILGIVPKEKLPTYGVFYEARTFTPGIPGQSEEIHLNGYAQSVPFGDLIFRFPFGTMAVEVCEDIWSSDGPAKPRSYSGAEVIVNISASPWRAGVLGTKREMLPTRSSDNACVLIYVSRYGGQDALVFDGTCFVYQNGQLVLESPKWQEGLYEATVDLDAIRVARQQNTTWRTDFGHFRQNPRSIRLVESSIKVPQPDKLNIEPSLENIFIPRDEERSARAEYFEDLLHAMKTGLSGYFHKTRAFERIGIALSGGKDSALCAFIAWLFAQEEAGVRQVSDPSGFVRSFISCFSLPTKFNSDQTRTAARQLCEDLGLSFREVPIERSWEVLTANTVEMFGGDLDEVTLQNIQARIRGNLLMNWANAAHALIIQTSNMTEKAVGYATYGGDMLGSYSLLGNLPKTVIIELIRYLQEKYAFPSLELLLSTPSSAELAQNQTDEGDLMPFPVLDACFSLFAGQKISPSELYTRIRQMFSDEMLLELRTDYRTGMLKLWVKRFVVLFFRSIWKWVQTPEAVHLGNLDLDRERALQLPTAMSTSWLDLEQIDNMPD